jgi:hypothetical protein
MTEINKEKDYLGVDCKCGNSGYISVKLMEERYTICPKCRVKHFYVTCKKCESGYIFPDTEKKEINLVENWWYCSFCRKKWPVEFNALPYTNWVDKSEIPEEVLNEGTKARKIFSMIYIGIIVMLFISILSPFKRIYEESQKQPKFDLPPINLTSENEWQSNFIARVSFDYPSDFVIAKLEDNLFEAENERFSIRITSGEMDEYRAGKIESIKTAVEENPEDPTVKRINVLEYTAYLDTVMSAEGIFVNDCLIPLEDGQFVALEVSADTRKPENIEPEIYRETEKLTEKILQTFRFKDY